jgi:hypothetical protein
MARQKSTDHQKKWPENPGHSSHVWISTMFIMIKSSVSPDHQSVFASNDGRTVARWNVESGATIPPYHQLKISLGTVLRGRSDGMKRPRGWHPRDFEWGFCLVFHATQAFSLCCGCCTLMLWRADSRIAIPSRRGAAAKMKIWTHASR